MMSILKTAFKYGSGLAGLSTIIFLGINKQWINSSLFTPMTSAQTFYAFIFSLALTLLLSVLFIFFQYKEKKKKPENSIIISATNNSDAVNNSGNGNVTITKGQ